MGEMAWVSSAFGFSDVWVITRPKLKKIDVFTPDLDLIVRGLNYLEIAK